MTNWSQKACRKPDPSAGLHWLRKHIMSQWRCRVAVLQLKNWSHGQEPPEALGVQHSFVVTAMPTALQMEMGMLVGGWGGVTSGAASRLQPDRLA